MGCTGLYPNTGGGIMRRLSAVLAVFLLLAKVSASFAAIDVKAIAPEIVLGEKPDKATQQLQEALGCFEQGQLDQCFELLTVATTKRPDFPPARLIFARLLLSKNRVQEGRASLEQAAAENPEYPGIYLSFGQLCLAEARLTGALLHFEKAASLPPPSDWTEVQKCYLQQQALAGQATVAEGRRHWQSAEEALSAWLDLEPDNGPARQRLARALFHVDKAEEALNQLKRAHEVDSDLDPAGISMGWLHHAKGEREKAGQWMKDAVTNAPNDPKSHFGYAAWLLEVDRPDEACDHVETAGRLGLESRELTLLLGQLCRARRDYEQAEQYFLQLHQESPADFQAGNLLALALVEQDDPSKRERARQLAEVNARQYPQSADALATLGWIHYRQGRKDEAFRALTAAASAGGASSQTAYFLAYLLADRGQIEDAERLLRTAIDAPGVFVDRVAAKQWLDDLVKQAIPSEK